MLKCTEMYSVQPQLTERERSVFSNTLKTPQKVALQSARKQMWTCKTYFHWQGQKLIAFLPWQKTERLSTRMWHNSSPQNKMRTKTKAEELLWRRKLGEQTSNKLFCHQSYSGTNRKGRAHIAPDQTLKRLDSSKLWLNLQVINGQMLRPSQREK